MPLHPRTPPPFDDRLWQRIDKTAPPPEVDPSLGPCWVWTGKKSGKAGLKYGTLKVRGVYWSIHRLSYEAFVGPIPDGYFIDHMCHVRLCANPSHLRAVTPKHNVENFKSLERKSISGTRNVYWNARGQNWRVSVVHDGVPHSGGVYKDKDEAARVAKELRLKLHTNNLVDRLDT